MMCEDMPITDEELWGVPDGDQPDTDPDRNYFDEHQPIDNRQSEIGNEHD